MTGNNLFITSTRIGDAVLSMGILSYILRAYPDSQVTIACGPLVESLFEGVPRLNRIIPLQKKSWNRHWISLWAETVATPWDMVVDLRNSAVSRMIISQKRFIYGSHISKSLHKVAQNAAVMGLDVSEATPCLFLSEEQKRRAAIMIPDGTPVLGVGPTANWVGKIWPVESFKTLVQNLTRQGAIFSGWRVAVFGAPGEETIAKQLLDSLPEKSRIDCIAKGNPGEAAANLARCQFYIGNDSGLMHSAAAAGIPTVGLFGPTNDAIYAPYGRKTLVIRTPESMNDLIGYSGFDAKKVTQSLMSSLSVEEVEQKVITFFAS